jgi:hypothetical protein
MHHDPIRIAEALKASPIWARLALTSQREHLVDQAADTMAALIAHRLNQPTVENDPRQLGLGL